MSASIPTTTQQQLQQLQQSNFDNDDFGDDTEVEQQTPYSETPSTIDPGHQFDAAVLGVGFGHVQYSIEERQFLQNELQQKLDMEMISKRDGPGGGKVHYIETWKAIAQTNRIFGFNGWSSRIMDINLDFIDQESTGRFTAGVSAIVRITLKDGTHREDIGYGVSENQKQKGKALDQAKKKAVSDALKRALKGFGHALGLSVYDKEHIKDVEKTARLRNFSKNGSAQDSQKPMNPHFNQVPGSPPRNTFVPMSPPKEQQRQQNTPPSSFSRVQKSSPSLEANNTNHKSPQTMATDKPQARSTFVSPPSPAMNQSPQQSLNSNSTTTTSLPGAPAANRFVKTSTPTMQPIPNRMVANNNNQNISPPAAQSTPASSNQWTGSSNTNAVQPSTTKQFSPPLTTTGGGKPSFPIPSFSNQQQQQNGNNHTQQQQQGTKRTFTSINPNSFPQKRSRME